MYIYIEVAVEHEIETLVFPLANSIARELKIFRIYRGIRNSFTFSLGGRGRGLRRGATFSDRSERAH